jgi:hypothetical protein
MTSTAHSSFFLDDDDDDDEERRDDLNPPISGWYWHLGEGWTWHTQSLLDAACSLVDSFLVLANRRLRLTPSRRRCPELLRRDMKGCGTVTQQVGALWQIDITLPPLLFNDERLTMLLLFLDRGGMIIIMRLFGVRFDSVLVLFCGLL